MEPLSTDAQTGESSTPAVDLVPSRSLGDLSDVERLEWRKTGTVPPKQDPARDAATPAAEPVAQVASTDAKAQPASETGDYKTKTAGDIQRLLEDRRRERERGDRLEREIAALRQPMQTRQADSSTATADTRPDPTKYDDLIKFQEDLTDWKVREVLRTREGETAQRAQQMHVAAETQRVRADWVEKWGASAAKHADFAQVVGGPTEIPEDSLVHAFIVSEPEGTEVLYHFQKKENRAELHRVLGLSKLKQAAELQRIAEQVTKAPTIKKITTAPDPSPTLGVRGNDALNESERALKKRDARAYIEAENRREMAAKGH